MLPTSTCFTSNERIDSVKALITSFLYICVLPAFAAPLICPQVSDASHEVLPGRCPANDASFVNNPVVAPRPRFGTGRHNTLRHDGPTLSSMNFQVLSTPGPLTDSQMKSLLGGTGATAVGGTSPAAPLPATPSIDPPAPDPTGTTSTLSTPPAVERPSQTRPCRLHGSTVQASSGATALSCSLQLWRHRQCRKQGLSR